MEENSNHSIQMQEGGNRHQGRRKNEGKKEKLHSQCNVCWVVSNGGGGTDGNLAGFING